MLALLRRHLLPQFPPRHFVEHLSTTIQPLISLFKSFDFSDADVASLLSRRPNLLSLDPHTALRPKLQFFHQIGVKPKAICSNPNLLSTNLDNRLLPNFHLLSSVVTDDHKLSKLLNREPIILSVDLRKLVIPRIRALQERNVPEAVVTTAVVMHPRAFFTSLGKFEQAFEQVLGMVCSDSLMFAHVLGVFAQMPVKLREVRMGVYRDLGWSEDQILAAMVRHPTALSVKEEKLRENARFFKEEFYWGPEKLCVYPVVLSMSTAKRIKPRFEIWQILVSKGLMKPTLSDPNYFITSAKDFLKFVLKHQKAAPELLDVLKRYDMESKK